MSQTIPVQKKSSTKLIALTVICIILAAGLVGVAAVYINNQSQISQKDDTIDSLTDEVAVLQLQLSQIPDSAVYLGQIANLKQQLEGLNDSYTGVFAEYTNLIKIVQMRASGIMYDSSFTQNANEQTILYENAVDYAGFVVVEATANATSTYAKVQYSFGEFNFDYNQTLGTSGTAAFPILPGNVQLLIGNVNETNSNTVTATATFYF